MANEYVLIYTFCFNHRRNIQIDLPDHLGPCSQMSGSAQGSSSSLTGTTLVSPFWSTMDGTDAERSSALFMFTFEVRSKRRDWYRSLTWLQMTSLWRPHGAGALGLRKKSNWRWFSENYPKVFSRLVMFWRKGCMGNDLRLPDWFICMIIQACFFFLNGVIDYDGSNMNCK